MGAIHRVIASPGGGGGGNLTHGSPFTVTGSGFGSKATAAPLIWDNCSSADGTLPTATYWDGCWPTSAPTSSCNMQYRPSGVLGISPPHANTGGYLTGAHEDSTSHLTGLNVAIWIDYTKANGDYLYFSWYNFVNPGWVFTGGTFPEDGNFKIFGYSVQGSIYESPNNWYISQWDGLGRGLYSATDPDYSTIINDDSGGSGLTQTGGETWQGAMINPLAGAWVKQEVQIKIDPTSGRLEMWENNGRNVDYTGRTDNYPGSGRSIGLGGFARSSNNANNRRYFADIYVDNSFRRLVLANNATYASATIVEPQPCTAWADGSITATCNKGALSAGAVYPFVQTAAGTWTGLTSLTMN